MAARRRSHKGRIVARLGIRREKGEMLFLEGKEGQEVVLRSTKANRKGGTRGRRFCKPEAKNPCKYSGLSAKRGAKRGAKKSARRAVGTTRGRAKTGFAAMTKAERVKIARKGGRAAARKAKRPARRRASSSSRPRRRRRAR